MTPKEKLYWLGFGRAAKTVLGPTAACSAGTILTALVMRSPAAVSGVSFPSAIAPERTLTRNAARVSICVLRSALADIGFDGVIETVLSEYGVHWGGYRISAENASKIREFVEANA